MSEPPRDVRSMSWRGSLWPDLPASGWAMLFGTTLPIRPTPRRSTPRLELAKPPSQAATSADIPAQQATALNSSVSPPPATSAGDAEQPVDASRQQAETPSAVAEHGETGLENQTVGAPASPIATQMQAEPAGIAASPEPKKAETASAAPPDAALRPSDVPAHATAAPPLPTRSSCRRGASVDSENSPTSTEGAETLCRGQIGRSTPARANCEASQGDGRGEGRPA